ncbi:MAG: hypothetical protein IBJ03_06755 [Gemmatimonadaceae bacterium]|nr:hypothetical protein [Gemmatimonadaceae bacterium]
MYLALLGSVPPFKANAQETKPKPPTDSSRADSAKRASPQLATVRVSARRWRRPTVSQAVASDPTGLERDGASLGLATTAQGSITALGATIPGLTLLSGANGSGLSALGLPASQTVATLNGITFGANDLPRELFAPARAVTSTYDVAQSGFAGAQLALRTFSGSIFNNGTLTWRTQLSSGGSPGIPSPGTPPFGISGSRSGPVAQGKFFYNIAAAVDRAEDRAATLRDAASGRTTAPGLSQNAAVSTLRVLDSLGITALAGTNAARSANTSGSAFVRIDLAPTPLRTANVVAYGSRSQVIPLSVGPLSAASRGDTRVTSNGMLLLDHASLYRTRFLSHTRAGISYQDLSGAPARLLPRGQVLIPSDSGSNSGLTSVSFGGNGTLGSRSTNQRLELRHGLTWYSADSRHLFRLASQLSREQLSAVEADYPLGRVTYPSLDALRIGQPSSFVRQLGQQKYSSSAWNAGLSLGDHWRITDVLFVQYGLRVDADGLSGSTGTSASGATRARSSVDSWYLSPRVGFSWNHGEIAQAGFGPRPRGSIRGGIGAFRGVHAPGELRATLLNTNNAGGLSRLECIGALAPSITWSDWGDGADLPTSCAQVDNSANANNGARALQADTIGIASNYAPATSWRGSIGWTGEPGLGLQLAIDATLSRTTGLTGLAYPEEFVAPSFLLPGENNRPVYFDPSMIDERLGIGRQTFATRSAIMHSRLRSRAMQLSTMLSPASVSPADRLLWGLGYAWTDAMNSASGFEGTTSGDPQVVEWVSSPYASRHRVTGFAAIRFANGAFISMGAQWQSGLPFTPLIGGDVNGDRLANDRAYISADLAGHSCLRGQIGRVAAAASCRGPSQTSVNASIVIPGPLMRLPSRSTVTVGIVNPLAGLDQLLHGSQTRGWGQSGAPDPVLVYPIGFSATDKAFRYAANPAFGDVRRDAMTRWNASRLTVDLRIPMSRPQHEQLLNQVMAPGRDRPGTRLTAEQVKQRYMNYGVINPVLALYRVRDSLNLTATQSLSLDSAVREFNARLDSIWSPMAKTLAAAEKHYDRPATITTIRGAQQLAWDALEGTVGRIRALLTASQMAMIDPAIATLLDAGAIARLRRTEFRY